MKTQQDDLKAIFCEAVKCPAGSDRLAYLEQACGGNPALRTEVEELLAAHDSAGGLLGSGPGTAAFDTVEETDEKGTHDATDNILAGVPGLSATDGDAADDAT